MAINFVLLRLVSATGSTMWAVVSAEGGQEYTVSLDQEWCIQDCALECTQCILWFHMYSCACYDHLIHSIICKVIHLLGCTSPAKAALQGAPRTLR